MLATLALCALAPQTTWYVSSAASPPGDGTLSSPYTRIDHALARSSTLSGDTVLVGSGDYVDEVIDFLGKDVVVRSLNGSAATRILGEFDPMNPQPAVRLD